MPLRRNKHGTTTAGDTAAITAPRRNPHFHGKSKKKWVVIVTTPASTIQGIRPNFNTVSLRRFNALGSRSRPARIRMMTKATFLKKNQEFFLDS